MKNIEIPYVSERGKRYRFFEILPGAMSWTVLTLPFMLSFFNPRLAVFFVIGFLLLWFARSAGLSLRSVQGFSMLRRYQVLPWQQFLNDLENGTMSDYPEVIPSWHQENLRAYTERSVRKKPSQLIHAVVIATYNESRDVLEPTIQSLLASNYDTKKIIMVIAYEERGGKRVEDQANDLVAQYGGDCLAALAIKHPDGIAGEVIGKGGNITFAGRQLQKYLEQKQIDPSDVIVTTLDADNRPHVNYLPALSYMYTVCPDPLHVSYQPVPMFTNNIWDAPAPMRVIATGNTFWNVVLSLRPHMIRNFSSHAQSMQALIDTDFWSVRTIVEDGHQFWRTYFRYDGKHEVYPLYVPIYQDAVLSDSLVKTLKAQFIQLRRWAWGASDIAYVAEKGFFTKNNVPRTDMIFKFLRLVEGHLSWATAPIMLAFSAFIPLLFNPEDYAANQLPIIASRIQTVALMGIFVTLFLSLKLLPPRPAHYKPQRKFFMIIQWVILPLTTILYNALSALYSQTRLMLGKYIDKFDVTEKAVVSADRAKKIQ